MNRLQTLTALAAKARAMTTPVGQLHTAPSTEVYGARAGWFRIANAAADSTPIYLYDEIGMYGVTASDFIGALNQVTTKQISMHINSPGGSVFDGIAIHAALVNHKATVTTVVDGIAASAASFIAQAGDVRGMEKPATMMIHDASGLVLGNAADMRGMADILDQMSDTIAGIYADRAGGDASVAGFRDLMKAETWFTSGQAVEAGLADEVRNDTAPPPPAPDNRRHQLIRARARVTLKGQK